MGKEYETTKEIPPPQSTRPRATGPSKEAKDRGDIRFLEEEEEEEYRMVVHKVCSHISSVGTTRERC